MLEGWPLEQGKDMCVHVFIYRTGKVAVSSWKGQNLVTTKKGRIVSWVQLGYG